MRSDSKYESFIRCGLNPSPIHFVHKYVDIFIDQETGYAIKEFSGRTAYFIVDKGQTVTAWDYDDLKERFPDKTPMKYTMIPSYLENNKHMLSKNENYREILEANDPANAAMLLSGNWKYTPSPNGMFEREYVTDSHIISESDLPEGLIYYRAYDKASSVPAKEGGDSKQLDPDYTASIMFAKGSSGEVYVIGNYIRDRKTQEQLARFRKKPGERDRLIAEQCLYDIKNYGDNVYCLLPQDPAAAGAAEVRQASLALQEVGVKVKKDPSHGNKSKRVRFEPFCVACHMGNVYWVKDTFDPATWDYMLLELENFNPDTKNNGYHDDLTDCFSSAWCQCQSVKTIKPFTLPNISSQTPLANYKRHN